MVGVSGAGLEEAVELVRSVGVLTAADGVEQVRQRLEIALEAGQVELASELREEERQVGQTLRLTRDTLREAIRRRLGVLPTTDS